MTTSRVLSILAIGGMVALSSLGRLAADEPLPKYTRSDGAAGVRQFVPGRWGMIAVDVVNPTEHPVEVLSAMYFADRPSLQYGRRFWLPAHSKRSSWYPLRMPADLPADRERVDVKSLLAIATGNEEVLSRSPGGQMLYAGMLPVVCQRVVTAAVLDTDDEETHAMIAAMRQSRALSIAVPNFRDPSPSSVETLDAMDQLVVASDRLTEDPAELLAVRRWLHGGGRVWIVLDRVQPATVSALLGDAMRFHMIDRVGLTEVRIEGPIPGNTARQPVRTFEDPVALVRVVGPDLAPVHTVDGWPASFWQRAGRGSVLFTTLGARGWIRQRTAADPKPKKRSGPEAPNVATGPLNHLAADFLQVRRPSPLEPDALRDLVCGQIGYHIVGRRTVSWMLGGFCAALLIIGLGLARVGRLPWLGWIGPALALAVAVSLGLMGRAMRTVVPSTAAVAQWVEVTPGVEDIRVNGLMALYQQDERAAPLGVRRGGVFFPDMAGLGGTVRRMVWTDLDAWHWENLRLPAGVRTAPFTYTTEMNLPIRARATFGPEGLAGVLSTGPFQDAGDAIIAMPMQQALAVRLGPEGSFTAGADDVLAAGHYLGRTVLSDRQRQRQQVYQRLLRDDHKPKYPDRPTMLVWASPLDMQLLLADDVERVGDALVAIPLELKRPLPGVRVTIPSPFLPYRAVALPGELAESLPFSNIEGKWLGPLPRASRVMLRFQCPEELLPLRPAKARMSVTLNAPSRKVKILGLDGARVVSLAEFQSPVGQIEVEVDRANVLSLDPRGGLRLGIDIGSIEGRKKTANIARTGWKIDEVRVDLTAETLER